MATDVTPPGHSRRRTLASAAYGGGRKVASGPTHSQTSEPAPPELLAFVKALARDIARADAAAIAAGVADPEVEVPRPAKDDEGSRRAE